MITQLTRPLTITFITMMVFHSCDIFAAKQSDSRAAAIIDNQIITNQQLFDTIEEQLYQAELQVYQLKYNQLKNMLLLRLIKAHPFSKGITPDEFMGKYVTKNPTATTEEVNTLIKVNKIPKDKINDEFRKKAADYIVGQKTRQAIDQWFSTQSREHGVVINLQKPARPRLEIPAGNSPVKGSVNAPITLVEYSDFQCPFCSRAEATVKELLKNYPDKIKLVYKNYPLSFHGEAFISAEAGLCAREQSEDKFWAMHDKMFADRKGLKLEGLVSKAKSIGLDVKQFESCVKNGKYASDVNRDIAEGNKFGVNSTPVFFVNGIMIKGAQPYQKFADIIEEELGE